MKLKKVVAVTLALTMCVGTLVACSKSEDKKDDKKETTKETTIDISGIKFVNEGKLSMGAEIGYPPFESYADDGVTAVGFDVDIATEIANRLGLEINIIDTSFDGIFAGLDKNYDIVCSGVTITPKRQKTMLFSTPYIQNYQSVVVRKGSDINVSSLKDLNKKVITVQKETTSDILMSDYKSTGTIDVEIVANEKLTSCFTQLKNGEVDAVVVDSTVAESYVAKNSDDYEIAFTDNSEPEEFGIAIGKGNEKLQAAINEALAQMEEDGYIADAYDYWFGIGEE